MFAKQFLSGAAVVLAVVCGMSGTASHAQQATEIQISYKNKQFQPTAIRAPANTAITLRIKNLDSKAMEFESKSLRVEKVVAASSEGIINLRPLKPGRYDFYDDFNEQARGSLTVQ